MAPDEIDYVKNKNYPAEGEAIRAVRVIPYLEPDEIELDADTCRDDQKKENILFQETQKDDKSHVGNSYVLKIDTEDAAAKVRAGTGAYAVVDLKPYGDAGENDIYDVFVLRNEARDAARPPFFTRHSRFYGMLHCRAIYF